MAKHETNLDRLFQALADPTRRAVLDQLAHGPAPVSDLAAPHDMALPSFTRHISVLEQAGLIQTDKKGRVRMCRLNAKSFRQVDGWLSGHRALIKAPNNRYKTLAKSLYGTPAKAR